MRDGERLAWTGQTSRLLRELLMSQPEYRRQWQERAERRPAGDVSQAGVARVIALHLWGSGERPDSNTALARNLKDRVRRALTGRSVTPQTLSWFVEAFHMDPRDARALWATFAGDRDTGAGISGLPPVHGGPRPACQTVALFERYLAGPDGALAGRSTLHTIMALEDGVDVFWFSPGPEADRVEVRHGGTAGPGGPQGRAIWLERTLAAGQTLALEYQCRYPPGGRPATEVRHLVRGRSENLDIAVTFHPARLPARVHWAVWRDARDSSPPDDSPPDDSQQDSGRRNPGPADTELADTGLADTGLADTQPEPLDRRHRARRFVPFVEDAAVGFRWEWEPPDR
jgi:hypothetical protein